TRGRRTEGPFLIGAGRASRYARAPKTDVRICRSKQQDLVTGSFRLLARPGEVVAIQVHNLVPRGDKVFHELLLRSRAGIDLCEGTKLRVRTEDQVDACSGPLERVRLAIAALVDTIFTLGRMPLCAHIQEVDKEVVGQNSGRLGEDTVLGAAC